MYDPYLPSGNALQDTSQEKSDLESIGMGFPSRAQTATYYDMWSCRAISLETRPVPS